jgi:hypothetical protein
MRIPNDFQQERQRFHADPDPTVYFDTDPDPVPEN